MASDLRSQGPGERPIGQAVEQRRARGCGNVQLTTHKQRTDAHRFCDRLDFAQSHFGYKMKL
ncbi:MAG: hypothetical protein KGL48_15095 [Sphingomonadales bacterium]|nr:hypothetical protein [Sphingomonadales bacterium]MDE2567606.1 hypothetical protein [Sphingomonadales bacterium]